MDGEGFGDERGGGRVRKEEEVWRRVHDRGWDTDG